MLIKYKPMLNFYLRNTVRYNSSLLNEAREHFKSHGQGEVQLEQDELSGVAIVTLDNPQKKNAISGSMMVRLEEIVSHLESWETGKGVILKAVGGIFCSGADISQYKAKPTSPHDGLLMSNFMHNTLMRFSLLPFVTVTLVHGKALGGGAEITTATDFRLFSSSGEVSFIQGKMGVVTGWGGGTRLTKLIGSKLALELLVTSKTIKSTEALEIGLCDNLLIKEDFLSEGKEWLSERLKHDCTVIQAMKKIIIGARETNLEESLLNERKLFAPLWGGPANLKALSQNKKHK